jgi:hypothetical protein
MNRSLSKINNGLQFLDVTNGCFHGNRVIKVEVLFDDGCAYKCICLKRGSRTCQERCPIYIDDEQYDNFTWGTSPTDSCFTVSICEKANKNLSPIPLDSTTSSTTISVPPMINAVSNDWLLQLVIAVLSFAAGMGTVTLTQWCFRLGKQSKAKVPITRAPHSLLTIPLAYKSAYKIQ